MMRLALILLAVFIIFLGVIVFSTPLPFGSVLILAGCSLLVSVSETAALRLRRLRMHYPRLNNFFAGFEIHAPSAAANRALESRLIFDGIDRAINPVSSSRGCPVFHCRFNSLLNFHLPIRGNRDGAESTHKPTAMSMSRRT
jgi:hypothetical protein